MRRLVLGCVCLAALLATAATCIGDLPAASTKAYRNAVDDPPADYPGPGDPNAFRLSSAYPSTQPAPCPTSECGWLAAGFPFDSADPPDWSDWAPYLDALKSYVRQGNDLSTQWNARVGAETRWFHVPWMAYDRFVGREFAHGMTNERTARYSDFAGDPPYPPGADPNDQFETWAVGMYNPWGGWHIGRLIDPNGVPAKPDSSARFPEGTVAAKLLFTSATASDFAFLEGSPSWRINRHVAVRACPRALAPVQLVQLDVAAVDERSPTGWVYGTFAYDGALDANDPWDRLQPVGLMWGNDPNVWPGRPDQQRGQIVQSVLAPAPKGFYEHFGCAPASASRKRLAGPVDNPRSACIACHQNAYVGPVGSLPAPGELPLLFFDGLCTISDPPNRRYFSNLQSPQPYPNYPGLSSLDTSLQLRVAYTNYAAFAAKGRPQDKCTQGGVR